jgi:hypothetical protein
MYKEREKGIAGLSTGVNYNEPKHNTFTIYNKNILDSLKTEWLYNDDLRSNINTDLMITRFTHFRLQKIFS